MRSDRVRQAEKVMIKVYYACANEIACADYDFEVPVSKIRLEKIGAIKSANKKAESLTAELLLNYACAINYKDIAIPVLYVCDEGGKPRVVNGEFCFSLSHSKGISAVAVAPFSVGIDVQNNMPVSECFASGIINEFDCKDKSDTLLDVFIKKESYVKFTGSGFTALPKNTVISGVRIKLLEIMENKYKIAVCSGGDAEISLERVSATDLNKVLSAKLNRN